MKIANDVVGLIGNTPMVRLNNASRQSGANILAKCEFMNPSGSVKDRIGYFMVEDAIKGIKDTKDITIIEPTSGNTGIALASCCAAKGIKLILTMPESMSIERRKLLKAFGAKLVLTPSEMGMNGAIQKAVELKSNIPKSIILQQFTNRANPTSHTFSTAKEILDDTDAKIDVFVAAVGTGGTISGIGNVLKKEIPDIHIVAVEPEKSAVLSLKEPSAHGIEGIGAGFVPDTLDKEVYDEVICVSDEDAINTARDLAKKDGLLVGISSGANVWASMQIGLRDQFRGKNIVTILCDDGQRYLSGALFE